MSDISANNKRIVKNTLLLYVRMLFMMAVNLYTSRIILQTLGVEDFGIYNVVGGVVAMFSIVSGSLSTAISRFITYELGTGDKGKLINIFSSSVTIQLGLGIIILILAEVIGVWFLNAKMTIPVSRMYAANWVFQLSILTFTINLISVPYNAAIIAHERMSAFAYISILEAVAKLVIVYLLSVSPIDRLIFYAILMTSVALIIRLVYGCYCKRHFEECTYHFIFDKELLKKMFDFAGWNFIGATSAILRDQGGNIVINLFCGPVANAARSISYQVYSAIYGFVLNFLTALNPQIIKSYANKNQTYLIELIFLGTRFSSYLLMILTIPILINTEYILDLWLKDVPKNSVIFTRLILFFAISETFSNPIITLVQATGKIKTYQLIVGGIQLLNFPISYILISIYRVPEIVFIVAIFLSQICLFSRLLLVRKMINININEYIKSVYFRVILVYLISLPISFIILQYLPSNFINFLIFTIMTFIININVILFAGCSRNERKYIYSKIQLFIKKYL